MLVFGFSPAVLSRGFGFAGVFYQNFPHSICYIVRSSVLNIIIGGLVSKCGVLSKNGGNKPPSNS